jgi:hypothetical protein
MSNRSSCNPAAPPLAIDFRGLIVLLCAILGALAIPPRSHASDAPQWMHTVASAPVPAHDEKTDAVLLYSETAVNVQSLDKIKTRVRVVYKILRPSGRDYGIADVSFNAHSKINGLRGWCIPAQGKDY